LRHVRASLYTKTARSIADERHEFLVRFYQQLVAEEAGER
jgi:HD superfamily phosphodiesterase